MLFISPVLMYSFTFNYFLIFSITVYFDKIYTKPYTRIGPYLIGILAAYLLFRRKMSNKPKHNWVSCQLKLFSCDINS